MSGLANFIDQSASGATVNTELTTADLNTGAGTDTQGVVGILGSSATGGQAIPGSTTDGLLVNLGTNNDVTVTGTVTANAGTNLNTSSLALEAGGNLANAATSLGNLDNSVDGNYLNVNANLAGTDVTAGAGAVAPGTPRVTLASDDPAVVSLGNIDNSVDGNYLNVNMNVAGTDVAAGSGTVSSQTIRTVLATDVGLPAGTSALGKILPGDIDITTHTNYARKYYTSTGAATDGIIWSPAAGKRWHVVTMYIQTSAAATITLEDDKAGGDDPVWKGELAANSGVFMVFPENYPMASGEDAADLIITTSAGNVYVTVTGYEI